MGAPLEGAGRTRKKKATTPPPIAKEVPAVPYTLKAPKGWECIADKAQLPATVEMVFIGAGKGGFTPSINLATEKTEMTLGEYVALACKYHEMQDETRCRTLGFFDTEEGRSELLQIDRQSQWGAVRFLQAALVKDGVAYVITATCLLDDFNTFYPQFCEAIRSFSIDKETTTEGDV